MRAAGKRILLEVRVREGLLSVDAFGRVHGQQLREEVQGLVGELGVVLVDVLLELVREDLLWSQ